MTVSELINLLEDADPDAEVRIMSQENWPFENAIRGIAIRDEMVEDCDCDRRFNEPHEDGCAREGDFDEGTAANDVFIVEGSQERYGSKMAWEVSRR